MEKSCGIAWRKLEKKLSKLADKQSPYARLIVTYGMNSPSKFQVQISVAGLKLPKGRECSSVIYSGESEKSIWKKAKKFYKEMKANTEEAKNVTSKRSKKSS